jgi:hypothetical protein
MNLKTTAVASLFAMGALISMGATAASDTEKATEVKPAASETKKKVKPHSHVEEKGGAVSSGSEQQAEKTEPVKNKKKHLHPRDAK